MKISELEGAKLDLLVAKAENRPDIEEIAQGARYYTPSTNWGIGGEIIDRECISIKYEWNPVTGERRWYAHGPIWSAGYHGRTALVAAMRFYVAHKLGVEVLEE